MPFTAPDWREESAYPKSGDDHNLSFWAWQFLRRNSTYQADWAENLRIAADVGSPFASKVVESGHGCSDAENICAVSPLSELEQRLSLLNAQSHIDERETRLAGKWGLVKFLDPASDDLPNWNGFSIDGGVITVLTHSVPDYRDDNYLTPQIDLRLSVEVLTAQFKTILAERERLINHRLIVPYTGRPQRAIHLYPHYLRVLDALTCGTTLSDIAAELLPRQDPDGAKKSVTNWKNAAVKIRDETYRMLPAFQIIAEQKKSKAKRETAIQTDPTK